MIDLYAMGSPNVVKVYIALEEMGLPYTVHPVDVFGEGQFKPEFLRQVSSCQRTRSRGSIRSNG
jgi:glutathione S-transferase